ncbi:MAG: glycosyltransferase family 9 protein [Solimonas sp.]
MTAAGDAAPRTAVVHHHSGIGDLICHFPYLRAIAARSRDGRVSVIARPSSKAAELLAAQDWVERVIEFDRKPRRSENRRGRHDGLAAQWAFVRALRALRFERIYILSGRARYAALARLAGIPWRAGYGYTRAQRLLLNAPPYIARHAGAGSWVHPEATAFALAHGLSDGPLLPRLDVPAAALEEGQRTLEALPRPRYAFAIGASLPAKRWPEARYAELAAALAAGGAGIALVGGPAEAQIAQAIVAGVPEALRPRLRVVAQPSILASAAVLRLCDVCVGNDTGALNLAVAVGTPSVGLFGASPPLLDDPLLHGVRGEGMAAIEVDAVRAALRRLPAAERA